MCVISRISAVSLLSSLGLQNCQLTGLCATELKFEGILIKFGYENVRDRGSLRHLASEMLRSRHWLHKGAQGDRAGEVLCFIKGRAPPASSAIKGI